MKKTKSEIKPLKIGKQSGTTYCFGCKDYTKNFRPQEVKMTNKVLREKSHFVACRSNKSRLIAWSVKKILKILTQKELEQKMID